MYLFSFCSCFLLFMFLSVLFCSAEGWMCAGRNCFSDKCCKQQHQEERGHHSQTHTHIKVHTANRLCLQNLHWLLYTAKREIESDQGEKLWWSKFKIYFPWSTCSLDLDHRHHGVRPNKIGGDIYASTVSFISIISPIWTNLLVFDAQLTDGCYCHVDHERATLLKCT
jgi:hypothetical protein